MTRDSDRSRVYAAEDLVFDETLFTEPLGATGIVEMARLIAADPWWLAEGIEFRVTPARRESHHSSARVTAGVARIRLSLRQEDAATLAHELAHLVATHRGGRTGHGPLFRAAELDVVAVVCGTAASARLARAFADDGLAIAPRLWQAPADRGERGLYGRWRLDRLGSPPVTSTSR